MRPPKHYLTKEYIQQHGLHNVPMRVWIKGKEQPGLAMARAIGDEMAMTVGVTCEPGKLIITK